MMVVEVKEDAMVGLTLRFHIATSAASVAHQRQDAGLNRAPSILQDYWRLERSWEMRTRLGMHRENRTDLVRVADHCTFSEWHVWAPSRLPQDGSLGRRESDLRQTVTDGG